MDGIKDAVAGLSDIPKQLVANVVFDQSVFVRKAIENLLHEGGIGLLLTGVMVLLFLGSVRATAAVFLSDAPVGARRLPRDLRGGGGTVNTMVLGGLALALSRLIDNSVVVLENIFRHMEMGESAEEAAEKGGAEVALPVLAATLTTVVVFFPVVFLYGVSRFLFVALALAVVFSLLASYFVALTVVPLFCARFLKRAHLEEDHIDTKSAFGRVIHRFNHGFERMLDRYGATLARAVARPAATVLGISGVCVLSFSLAPLLGVAFFPRTDPGQFVINLKAPSGTRLELTEQDVARVEEEIRKIVPPEDLGMIVSNIGTTPGFSSIYTPNSASAHGLRTGQPQGRPPGRQLRVHGSGPSPSSGTPAGARGLFPVGRSRRRRPEPGPSGAHRHPGQRHEPREGLHGRARHRRRGPQAFRRQRPARPAGPRLPVAASRRRPHARQSRRSLVEGSRHERHHGPDLQPDDRAELLGRSRRPATTTC